jgi:hypothetical protein
MPSHIVYLVLALVLVALPIASISEALDKTSRDIEITRSEIALLSAVSEPKALWKRRRGGGSSSSDRDSNDTEVSQDDDDDDDDSYEIYQDLYGDTDDDNDDTDDNEFTLFIDPRTNMSGECPNVRNEPNYDLGYTNADDPFPLGDEYRTYLFNGTNYDSCPLEWWRGEGCNLGPFNRTYTSTDDDDEINAATEGTDLDSRFYPGGRSFGSYFLADYNPASSAWGQIYSTNTCWPQPPCCVRETPAARLSREELGRVFPGNWGADVSYGWLFNYTRNRVYVFDSAGQETKIGIICVCAAVSACGCGTNIESGYFRGIEAEIEKNEANRSRALRVVEYQGKVVVSLNGTISSCWPILTCGGNPNGAVVMGGWLGMGSVLGAVMVVAFCLL